jgi:hypothetical protein
MKWIGIGYATGLCFFLAQDLFDVLITIDRSLEFQQNLAKLRLGVVVVMVPKNQLILAVEIRASVTKVRVREVIRVPSPRPAT